MKTCLDIALRQSGMFAQLDCDQQYRPILHRPLTPAREAMAQLTASDYKAFYGLERGETPRRKPEPEPPVVDGKAEREAALSQITKVQWRTLTNAQITQLTNLPRGTSYVARWRREHRCPAYDERAAWEAKQPPPVVDPVAVALAGIKRKQWSQLTNDQIAKLAGVSAYEAGRYRVAQNLPMAGSRSTDYGAVTAYQWVTLSSREIAEMLECAESTVVRHRKENPQLRCQRSQSY